ncbi:MAG: hypothetical protein JRD89_01930 [Deltaproteobacteria bacterium]|nr:hypothetical protein [Deltaproteobacteria bacterium]
MLNTNAFLLLAGDPEHWDNETIAKCRPGSIAGTYNSHDLCALQVDQSSRGQRSAQLSLSLYGWTVRYASGLQDRAILFSSKDHDPMKAYEWGCKWANADPNNREFYVGRKDVHDHEQLNELVRSQPLPFCAGG